MCLVAQPFLTLRLPWSAACQAPLSMGILQARILEGLLCPSPELPSPGIEPRSPALQTDCLLTEGIWANLLSLHMDSISEWKLLSHVWLCDPMDYTVQGIFQARILEWVAFPFSTGSSQSRDQTQVSHIASGFFTSWTSREATISETNRLFLVLAIRKRERHSTHMFLFQAVHQRTLTFLLRLSHWP